ncbi:MAG: tetratricopeptide repeat protein [Thiogranum sp.]
MAIHSNTHNRKRKARHLAGSNRLGEARELYLKICRKTPQDKEAWLELSVVSRKLGALQEAEQACRKVLEHHPNDPDALHALGAVLHRQQRMAEAVACYQQALQINPDNVETHYFLANAFREQGAIADAEAEYQNTIALQPDHIEALNNLSALLTNQGEVQRAAELLRRALQIQPNSHQMLINLGRTSLHAGNANEAEAAFRQVIKLQPGLADAHSNLLACLNYLQDRDSLAIFEDHRHWSEIHTSSIQLFTAWSNKPDPQRRLRVGYVSPDLCEHSVARFLEPVLSRHDRKQFEVTCYSDVAHPDATTTRLRGLCAHWRETSGLSHEQLAECIRKDRIDILVDLTGHTAHNRLPMFARKPAPIQVTWLGYPNTTGLSAIDFRLTDARADPPGDTEALHTETLVRLPFGFLCYGAPQDAPETGQPPSQSAGHVTFGSFNNLAKTTPEVIRVWSRILAAVPDSRLLLKSRATGDPGARQQLLSRFGKLGINSERIGFLDPLPSHYAHLSAYRQIDIALDTFPYNGTTTTCEALWMGVPVITLAGRVHAARVGASLLAQVGLEDLVTADEDEYVSTAVQLSGNTERVAAIRNGLRETLRYSSLCDEGGFTIELEQAYRRMWTDWCRSQNNNN